MDEIAQRTAPRRRTRFGVAALLVLSLGFAACGDDGAGSTDPAASSAAGTTSAGGSAMAGASGSSAPVSAINQVKFLNPEVRVSVGGSVEFDNKDTQAHTATGDDGSFDTGLIAAGAKTSVKFEKAGTFAYHCSLHPFMKAQVIVA